MGDSSKWEYMLPSNEKPLLLLPNQTLDVDDANADEEFEDVCLNKKKKFIYKHKILTTCLLNRIKLTMLKNTWIYHHHG